MRNHISTAAFLLSTSIPILASAQGGDVVQSVSVFIERQQSILSSIEQQVQTDTERSSDYVAYSSVWNSVSSELVAITSEAATNAAASSTLSVYWTSLAPYIDELNNFGTAPSTTSTSMTNSPTTSSSSTSTSSGQSSETTTSSGSGSNNNQIGVGATIKNDIHLGVMGSAAACILALAILL